MVHTNAEVGAQLEEDPSQREIFEDIVNESSQMSRMVENLLFWHAPTPSRRRSRWRSSPCRRFWQR